MVMNLRERVKEVFAETHLMSLATSDAEGLWVADVLFVFDDELTIYWMSSPDARHSRAIGQGAGVAGTITASVAGKVPNFGLQFSGTAEKIKGPRYDLAVKHYEKRGRVAPAEDEDVLKGRSWYQLTPASLWLIDEANFGYERQEVVS